MAFDQTTRNRLQRIVNDARGVLEEEFTRQLQNDYGMDPNIGSVTDLATLRHINDAQRETARILRDTLAHYCASGDMDARQAVDRIIREQAFTVLNRLAALRMAEARGILVESVGNGFQAKGFQLYARLSGTALGETGDAYRVYLFSVFDELGQDLPGLFDRFSPQGRLFPREAALLQILKLINDIDIATLWSEDETIGWIYQYFNSKEERKAMRDASQAPRNSRELAVRNQFFTPRYVVEFLVDNTLGRLWFNATGGETSLRDRCQYLLIKPDVKPESANRLRDPRTLKLLDPACGSMHFGLYAFDLFMEIYRESWAWEQHNGPGSLDVSTEPLAALKPLSHTYKDEATFLSDVPRLIIENNIYGVDIDPRAVQIASLALWLRSQREWHDSGLKAKDRPLIGRGNIVAAVAPPAELDLREQFAGNLDSHDAELFEKTLQLLRGLPELGVLLQVEREIPNLIRQIYLGKGTGLFAQQEQENWREAEARLRLALTDFAHAAKSTYQGRLFAQDALQGLKVVDLCRANFDVIVMNPPFGDPTSQLLTYLENAYPTSKHDLATAFIERALMLGRNGAHVGWISPRTWFSSSLLESFRRNFLYGANQISNVIDLGIGVLDAALVETAACTATVGNKKNENVNVIRLLSSRNKEEDVLEKIRSRDILTVDIFDLTSLPRAAFGYWFPREFRKSLANTPAFGPSQGSAKQGLATTDDYRFLRTIWEVPSNKLGLGNRWVPFAKGGEYEPYFDDLHLVIEWENNGRILKEYLVNQKGQAHWSRRIAGSEFYGKAGITYPERTTSDLSMRPLPKGSIFSATGQAVFLENNDQTLAYLGLSYTRIFKQLIELFVGGGDASESGSAARHYTSGILNEIPIPKICWDKDRNIPEIVTELIALRRFELKGDEVSFDFVVPALCNPEKSLSKAHEDEKSKYLESCLRALELANQIEEWASELYGLTPDFASDFLGVEICPFPTEYPQSNQQKLTELAYSDVSELTSAICERRGYKRAFTKKGYWSNRILELASHYFESHPKSCSSFDGSTLSRHLGSPVPDLVSYIIGVIFGRWDIRYATGKLTIPETPGPFDSLPACPPGQLRAPNGLASRNVVGYPFEVAWDGVVPEDAGHPWDIERQVQTALGVIWGGAAEGIEIEVCKTIGVASIREYLRPSSGFFAHHLSRYSKSRRKAPIYWPLSTSSGSYTLWIYYPSLSSQTLYTALNDFVEPKLRQVIQSVSAFRAKGAARSREDEKQFEALQSLELELTEFREALQRIAPNYKPNQDDGVEITASPLWSLFRHRPWQNILRETWNKLGKGDHDWAHLALNYWPDRVRQKCISDISLAITHGLEELYVKPDAKPTKTRGKKKSGGDN
jgi:hypothetical protein